MTEVIRTIAAARQWVQMQRAGGKSIGLVPTMGALHTGHLSLIHRAQKSCDRVIATIFVNPLQFGPGEDFERYPRDFDRDLALLEHENVDAVFHPDAPEMYPVPPLTSVSPGTLADTLCGASRPGHFQGVATVVAKLFHIVPADRAFFGEKDAQQLAVIRAMVRELSFPIAIEGCPTVREPDGLAMSSRNAYLSPDQRAKAPVLYRALQHAQRIIESGNRQTAGVEAAMREMIGAVSGADLDYARVVDLDTLKDLQEITGPVLIAVAVRFGKTRLIDNVVAGLADEH
jgi:pantoate--beta-alanine ligase